MLCVRLCVRLRAWLRPRNCAARPDDRCHDGRRCYKNPLQFVRRCNHATRQGAKKIADQCSTTCKPHDPTSTPSRCVLRELAVHHGQHRTRCETNTCTQWDEPSVGWYDRLDKHASADNTASNKNRRTKPTIVSAFPPPWRADEGARDAHAHATHA